MGYAANTTGTITGGSEEVGVIKESFLLGTLHRVYQKSTSTVKRIAGVSRSTAQNLCKGYASLTDYRITQSGGTASAWDTVFACQGTKQSASYAQIGDSNLYEVTIVTTTLVCSETGWPFPSS